MADQLPGNVDRIKAPTGPLLAGAVVALSAASGAAVLFDEGPRAALTVWPWLALVCGLAWALYWRPEVAVSDGGVRLVNVLRTIDVPWPALRGVDTKWALTLDTAWGRYRAWAAPAPGRGAMRRELREQRSPARRIERRVLGMPANTMGRTADLAHTDSGAAAQLVNTRWQRVRDAGHLDGATVEHDQAPVRWHWELLVGAVVLIGLAAFGLTL